MKRLSKVMAASGVASRRACETLIWEGKVAVNGTLVLKPQTLVNSHEDVITVDGIPVTTEQDKVYFLLNKPSGYVCSNKPLGSKKLVIDLFKDLPYRLFTVGRLDRDTTGLLLVTNDGHFAQNVIHPSRSLAKEYLVKTRQEITHEHLLHIAKGGLIEKTWVKPLHVTKVRKGTLKITVGEGKKREVRLLIQQSGLDLLSLHRIRIGPILLGNIPLGTYRALTEKEQQALLHPETQYQKKTRLV